MMMMVCFDRDCWKDLVNRKAKEYEIIRRSFDHLPDGGLLPGSLGPRLPAVRRRDSIKSGLLADISLAIR